MRDVLEPAARHPARRQRRRAHHRARGAAPGASARARRPARHAAGPARRCARTVPAGARPCCSTMLAEGLAGRPHRGAADAAPSRRSRGADARRRRDRHGLRRGARRPARRADRTATSSCSSWKRANAPAPASRNLRVKFNKVHGFYIEVTNGRPSKVPADYQPPPDAEERRALHHARAEGLRGQGRCPRRTRALAREKMLYEHGHRRLQGTSRRCRAWRARWPSLDALAALAERATTLNWCRPQFVREPCIDIEGGRHPVVEARLRETGAGEFMANDCRLDATRQAAGDHRPEHGRQEHVHAPGRADRAAGGDAGAYVPATACRLGPIDAIHTRIGAADDLANAQSTFMLEMTEGAAILHGATEQLAGADGRDRPRHLHLRRPGAGRRHRHATCTTSARAFTLFATHYFELTEFPAKHAAARSTCTVSAVENGDEHRLPARDPGRSGEPQLRRAGGAAGRHAVQPGCSAPRATLAALETRQASAASAAGGPVRGARGRPGVPSHGDERALSGINPDMLSPKEALDAPTA